MAAQDLRALTSEIVACRACPRLVAWREDVAREKRAAYRDEEYWGRPVPGFGDPEARLLLVGLAPAAHGGNRTGRVFTGDRYSVDAAGYHTYQGRSDDLLKVGGIWVSPLEVETALLEHGAVRECAVVGREDADGLVKPAAYGVLRNGDPSEGLAWELRAFVKDRLAPYKYPRWIEFVPELPKTSTGKVQRYKLRQP